jgi:hypothetical protein
MRQLTIADLRARGIDCEPAPAPIFLIPPPGPDGIPGRDFTIAQTSIHEFASDDDAFAYLATKKGLMVRDEPPVWLTLIAEAQDFRSGTFIKAWWPGAPSGRSGRLGDHSDIPLVEALRCHTIIAGLAAEGREVSDEARPYRRRIFAVQHKLTQEEKSEVDRRLPILKAWAEKCESGRQALARRQT